MQQKYNCNKSIIAEKVEKLVCHYQHGYIEKPSKQCVFSVLIVPGPPTFFSDFAILGKYEWKKVKT